MPDLAVIKATFSDFRIVKTRKVMQMVFEIPLEQGPDALQKLGFPIPAEEKWCAIALLSQDRKEVVPNQSASTGLRRSPQPSEFVQQQREDKATPPAIVERRGQASEKGKERYREADEWQQALIRACAMCDDPRFQEWLARRIGQQYRVDLPNGNRGLIAGGHLRRCLNLATRADIASNVEAFHAFIALETEYKQAIGQFAEERG